MKIYARISGVLLCLLLLIIIRRFELVLFYDPFLSFFKQYNYNHITIPQFDTFKLFLSLILRFSLNSILTLVIIQLWFKDKKITKVSAYILGVSFILFSFLYLISLFTNFGLGYMPTFYIRRILIQPLLLILLIPAIYYYKNSKKIKSDPL